MPAHSGGKKRRQLGGVLLDGLVRNGRKQQLAAVEPMQSSRVDDAHGKIAAKGSQGNGGDGCAHLPTAGAGLLCSNLSPEFREGLVTCHDGFPPRLTRRFAM